MPPQRPFRRVYRDFPEVDFDPAKSDAILEARGFDLAYIARIFPGIVIEREDTRGYGETRYQAIGEVDGVVYVVVYTRRGSVCRLITAWEAEPHEVAAWDAVY